MSICNEMLIRRHICMDNLYDHVQVLLIHSIAKQLANLQVALEEWSKGKIIFMTYKHVGISDGNDAQMQHEGILFKHMYSVFCGSKVSHKILFSLPNNLITV